MFRVVNYNVDNGWTTFLDKFKNTVPEISNEVQNLLGDLDDLTEFKWNMFYEGCEFADKNFVKFVETSNTANLSLKTGNEVIEQYQQYLANATGATSKFSVALKTIGADIAIMLAVTVAIKTVSAIWDKVNVTVAETQEKIDELSSSISTLESEYNELKSKKNLTDIEKARLEYLKDRISLEERLLKIEEERLAKEKYGSKFTDYFDKDSYAHKTYFDSNDSLYNDTDKKIDRTQYNVDEYKKAVENGDEEKQLKYTKKLEAKRLEHEEKYLTDAFNADDLEKLASLKFGVDYDEETTIEEFEELLDKIQLDADGNPIVVDTEFENVDSTSALSQIQSLSEGLDQLDKIYADVLDGGDFDFSSILNNEKFEEAFKDCDSATDKVRDKNSGSNSKAGTTNHIHDHNIFIFSIIFHIRCALAISPISSIITII